MTQPWRGVVLIAALAGVSCLAANGQEAPSLGDVARQARAQRQDKPSQTPTKTAPEIKTPKVITNDEIPEHSEDATDASAPDGKDHGPADGAHSSAGPKMSAEEWKAQIRHQKELVNTLEGNMEKLNNSIRFTDGACVSGCVQWNERQQRKQQEVERMRVQLETQKQHLQEMQEAARQQGFGSSVYEP